MEKALIDILVEEKELIKEIARLEDTVKRTSERRIFLLMNTMDLDLDKPYIKHLQREIDDMNNQKFDCKRKLEEVRRSIAGYFNYVTK